MGNFVIPEFEKLGDAINCDFDARAKARRRGCPKPVEVNRAIRRD